MGRSHRAEASPPRRLRQPPVPLPWQGRGIGLGEVGRPPDARGASVVRPLQGGEASWAQAHMTQRVSLCASE